jgi:hypothetical protein
MKVNRMLHLVVALAAAALFTMQGSTQAAQPVKRMAPAATQVAQPVPLNLPCDVSISYIQYFNCPCNLELDAYYVDQYLSVKLFNASTLKPTVELKVTYFDITQNRLKTITRNVTFNGRGSQNVVISNHPLLIKRSYGVQAEVTLKSKNMHDPDLSNNRKTQMTCGPVVE